MRRDIDCRPLGNAMSALGGVDQLMPITTLPQHGEAARLGTIAAVHIEEERLALNISAAIIHIV